MQFHFKLVLFFIAFLSSCSIAYAYTYQCLGVGGCTHKLTPEAAAQQYFSIFEPLPGYKYSLAGCTPVAYNDRDYQCKGFSAQIGVYNINVYRHGNSCPADTQLNPTTGECALDPSKGDPGSGCSGSGGSNSGPGPSAGNPINFSVGNKFQVEKDYSVGQLSVGRFYNSLDGLWRHSYSTHLRISSSSIALVRADGKEIFFKISGNDFVSLGVDMGELSKRNDGWIYKSSNNEVFYFDSQGRLAQQQSQAINIGVTYVGDVVQLLDSYGNKIEIQVHSGQQPALVWGAGFKITYSYDEFHRLSEVSRMLGSGSEVREYHYLNDSKLLSGITNEKGVRYVTWEYDNQGRAISSRHGDAGEVQVSYSIDGSSTVTNELGKQTTYLFQAIRGIKRITAIKGEPSANCPDSNSTFTYDDRGLLKTKTSNKGHLTTYDYNERGLEVSRTEAAGTAQARTITTEWHPDWFLPATVTEPDRIIQYTYDAQGRQLSQAVTQR